MPEAPANERPYTVRARGCIACGTENPFSLGLRPYRDGDKVVCELRIRREFRGYSNVAHGGTTCMVLDEIMGAAASVTLPETVVATVRLSVDYARPVRVEEPLRGEAWVVSHEGRDLTIEGRLLDEEGRDVPEGADLDALVRRSHALVASRLTKKLQRDIGIDAGEPATPHRPAAKPGPHGERTVKA